MDIARSIFSIHNAKLLPVIVTKSYHFRDGRGKICQLCFSFSNKTFVTDILNSLGGVLQTQMHQS